MDNIYLPTEQQWLLQKAAEARFLDENDLHPGDGIHLENLLLKDYLKPIAWKITPEGIEALRLSPPAPSSLILVDVPFHSQTAALWGTNDCGPATVRMLYGKMIQDEGKPDPSHITVDMFARRIMKNPLSTTFTSDLKKLAAMYGMKLEQTNGPQLKRERVEEELRDGNPMIALVIYEHLAFSFVDYSRHFAHYIVITGFDGSTFRYSDVLAPDDRGKDLPIEWERLAIAMNPGQNKYFSVPFQGCFYRGKI